MKVTNFINSATNYITNGMPNVLPETRNKRLEICHSCDKFNPTGMRCNECGCFLLIKTNWATEKCPLDKWGAEISTEIPPPQPHQKDCGCKKKNV